MKKIVIYNKDYNQKLNNLPSSVELIKLPTNYKLKIDKIPKNFKKVICSKDYEFVDDFNDIEVEYY